MHFFLMCQTHYKGNYFTTFGKIGTLKPAKKVEKRKNEEKTKKYEKKCGKVLHVSKIVVPLHTSNDNNYNKRSRSSTE